jgi:hypothetical protein
MNMIGNWLNYL